mgnify:CR=1 FL=1
MSYCILAEFITELVKVEIRWEDIVSDDDSNKVFIFDMEFDEMLEENEEIAQGGPGSEVWIPTFRVKLSFHIFISSLDLMKFHVKVFDFDNIEGYT